MACVGIEPVKELVALYEVVYHGGEGVGLAVYVGLDASAIAHRATVCGAELLLKGVGEGLDAAVVVVLVGLYAASAGDIVARSGDLELSAVGEVAYGLDESFAVGACADDDGSIHVLQATADYL